MNVFAEKNFNCVRMRVSQKYVVFEKVCCIEEDRNPMKSSSGRLLGIDLQTKKNFKMQLDGEENNMAIATMTENT